MHRRAFLTALAAGTLGVLSGCGDDPSARTVKMAAVRPSGTHASLKLPAQTAGSSLPPPAGQPIASGSPQLVDRIVGEGRRFALTVDDGTSTEVLSAYVDFVIASGLRMTFFPNGINDSWQRVRTKLGRLVESGQVQLGNHTWSHPDVTTLSATELADQLDRNERFLRNSYGVDGRPYFRPPYGSHNASTDAITGELGFSRTVTWWGSLGDSAILSPDAILAQARTWFVANRIVIGHANHPSVTHIYPQLIELIRQRALQSVTLRDVFGDLPLDAELASS